MEKFIPMTSGYCPRLIPMSGDAPHLIHIHNIEESSDSMNMRRLGIGTFIATALAMSGPQVDVLPETDDEQRAREDRERRQVRRLQQERDRRAYQLSDKTPFVPDTPAQRLARLGTDPRYEASRVALTKAIAKQERKNAKRLAQAAKK